MASRYCGSWGIRGATAGPGAHGGGAKREYAHGFLNDRERGHHVPFLVKFTGPIMGYGPHAAAAQDARRRITEFFATHLR